MLPAIAAALIGAGVSGVGMALKNTQRKQNQQDQKDLMNLQQENQMGLNRQMQQIEMENWENTNYDAQRKQMEKAGLNPGLMYGGSGGGSMIMDSGSGGSAAGGQAQRQDLDTTALGMQLAQITANTEVLKAQARNLNADADVKEGKNPSGAANIENTIANTELTKLKTANEKITNEIANKTIDEVIAGVKANNDKAQSEARSALVKANVDENTKKATEEKINAESINTILQGAVMKMGMKVDEATINKMAEDIAINKFNANTNAAFQGLDKVAGNQLLELINKIKSMFGIESNIKQIE
jgi:hypothetical protein